MAAAKWHDTSVAFHAVGRRRVRRLMARMGLAPIYQRPRTSDPHPEHRIYPYLLSDLKITRPGHVWCADIRTCRCGGASSISSPSWTGRRGRCSPGGYGRGILRRGFEGMLSKMKSAQGCRPSPQGSERQTWGRLRTRAEDVHPTNTFSSARVNASSVQRPVRCGSHRPMVSGIRAGRIVPPKRVRSRIWIGVAAS